MRWTIPVMLLACNATFAQQVATDAASARPAATDEASAPPAETAAEQPAAQSGGGVKTLSGMSILGNEEAPKSLVIVPWKSSRIGDGVGVTNSMDDRARPVDRDVFMRELRYFELRSATDRDGS